MSEPTPTFKKQDLVVTRILDAPLALVWKAWTEPERVKQWWGPQHYTSPDAKIDLREHGKFVFCMRAPQDQGGQDSYSAGVYTKIVPMERLEFTQTISDPNGNPINPTDIGLPPEFPAEIHTVVLFKPKGDLTELTVTQHDWPVSPFYVYALAGLHQSIDKLAEALKQ